MAHTLLPLPLLRSKYLWHGKRGRRRGLQKGNFNKRMTVKLSRRASTSGLVSDPTWNAVGSTSWQADEKSAQD